jgi:hypothetical protein
MSANQVSGCDVIMARAQHIVVDLQLERRQAVKMIRIFSGPGPENSGPVPARGPEGRPIFRTGARGAGGGLPGGTMLNSTCGADRGSPVRSDRERVDSVSK